MPKKTAYSRSGAQRNKTKQKSFELVRPAADENVLGTVEGDEVEENAEDDVIEVESAGSDEVEEEKIEEVKGVKVGAGKSVGAKVSTPAAAVISAAPATGNGSSPKSAAARLAARRQAAQKAQRAPSSLITVEHYSYVRKDLIFILILAIVMFSAIIVLHFVLGN